MFCCETRACRRVVGTAIIAAAVGSDCGFGPNTDMESTANVQQPDQNPTNPQWKRMTLGAPRRKRTQMSETRGQQAKRGGNSPARAAEHQETGTG